MALDRKIRVGHDIMRSIKTAATYKRLLCCMCTSRIRVCGITCRVEFDHDTGAYVATYNCPCYK